MHNLLQFFTENGITICSKSLKTLQVYLLNNIKQVHTIQENCQIDVTSGHDHRSFHQTVPQKQILYMFTESKVIFR